MVASLLDADGALEVENARVLDDVVRGHDVQVGVAERAVVAVDGYHSLVPLVVYGWLEVADVVGALDEHGGAPPGFGVELLDHLGGFIELLGYLFVDAFLDALRQGENVGWRFLHEVLGQLDRVLR